MRTVKLCTEGAASPAGLVQHDAEARQAVALQSKLTTEMRSSSSCMAARRRCEDSPALGVSSNETLGDAGVEEHARMERRDAAAGRDWVPLHCGKVFPRG